MSLHQPTPLMLSKFKHHVLRRTKPDSDSFKKFVKSVFGDREVTDDEVKNLQTSMLELFGPYPEFRIYVHFQSIFNTTQTELDEKEVCELTERDTNIFDCCDTVGFLHTKVKKDIYLKYPNIPPSFATISVQYKFPEMNQWGDSICDKFHIGIDVAGEDEELTKKVRAQVQLMIKENEKILEEEKKREQVPLETVEQK